MVFLVFLVVVRFRKVAGKIMITDKTQQYEDHFDWSHISIFGRVKIPKLIGTFILYVGSLGIKY